MEATSQPRSAPSDLDKLKDLVRSETFPFWLFLSLWFGQLCLALEPSWGDGTYYDYGYMIILLVPFFFLTRWSEIEGAGDRLKTEVPKLVKSPWVITLFLVAFCPIVILRLIQTVDSGWRAPLVSHAVIVIAYAAFCLARVVGWKNLIRFAPCAILICIMSELTRYSVVTPKRPEATCLMALFFQSPDWFL